MLANQSYEALIAQQWRSDMMRQAEHERTVRRMTAKRSSSMVSLRRSVGNWLIGVGERLRSQQPSLRNVQAW